ncbi:hypothetical protein [Photorhabdus temperata]|uniref:hypothetical protein n=1 Tax=Photorhabdus temperata TaxID=574560 RepID=UPI000FFBFAC6|nr:hypothetical protein [Photorhabdus temperata]
MPSKPGLSHSTRNVITAMGSDAQSIGFRNDLPGGISLHLRLQRLGIRLQQRLPLWGIIRPVRQRCLGIQQTLPGLQRHPGQGH